MKRFNKTSRNSGADRISTLLAKIKELDQLKKEEFALHQERMGMISVMQDDEFDRHYGRMAQISREICCLNEEIQKLERTRGR